MSAKKIMYWCSVVLPIFDILKGVVMAIMEIPGDVKKIHENRKYLEEYQRFVNEESYEDMTEGEFVSEVNKINNKKKGKK
jgi:hypothetical protein